VPLNAEIPRSELALPVGDLTMLCETGTMYASSDQVEAAIFSAVSAKGGVQSCIAPAVEPWISPATKREAQKPIGSGGVPLCVERSAPRRWREWLDKGGLVPLALHHDLDP
jgi:hypothetical protein